MRSEAPTTNQARTPAPRSEFHTQILLTPQLDPAHHELTLKSEEPAIVALLACADQTSGRSPDGGGAATTQLAGSGLAYDAHARAIACTDAEEAPMDTARFDFFALAARGLLDD